MGNKRLWDITDQFRAVAAGNKKFLRGPWIFNHIVWIMISQLSSYSKSYFYHVYPAHYL